MATQRDSFALTAPRRLWIERVIALTLLLTGILSASAAQTVNVAWDPSPDSSVVGFKVYYSTNQSMVASGTSIDVGSNLVASISNLSAGTYYFGATAYNASGVESDLSNIIATNVVDSLPSITTQPSSLTRNAGAIAIFSIAASGAAPLTYHWSKNGATLSDGGTVFGATTASLTINNVSGGDAGSYQCAVTNSAGGATSAVATLSVIIAPAIAGQPSSQTVAGGTAALFNVTATGTAPLAYSWKKNGVTLVNGGNIFGATTASLTVGNTALTDGASYFVVVTNSAGVATSATAVLVVQVPPTISTQPSNYTRNTGTTAAFSITAQGNGYPLSYSWLKNGARIFDGGNLSGTSTATFNITNISTTDAGSYQCVATTSVGTTTSSAGTLTVIVPAAITGQPASQTVNTGALAVFSATTTGTAPLNYSWRKNGAAVLNSANITGATTASLSITNIAAPDTGSYTIVVTNAGGSVTSIVATLTVISPPTIATQPVNVTTNTGASAMFAVSAQGGGLLGYQWSKNGVALTDGGNILGSATTTLSLLNLGAADAGSYRCVVTNSAGSATSSSALLTIIVPPSFTTQPANQTANAGGLAVFAVTASGTAPLNYLWFKNGAALANSAKITGATTASLSITNLIATDAGSYTVVVTNAAGSVSSAAATLVVITPPSITSQPSNVTTNASSAASFTVSAQGTAPLTFQWQKNGIGLADAGNISGSTSATLNLLNLTSADAGSYRCVVTNAAGAATSSAGMLTVVVPPSVTTQPGNQTANVGALVMFSLGASGTAPLSYSWFKNGSLVANSAKISGATAASLSITNVAGTDAGSYTAVVTNAAGSVTSVAATLVVIVPPSIATQPSSATANANSFASFTVGAQGSAPLSYSWFKNGAAVANNAKISGATTASLSITNLAAADAGTYTVAVTNAAGSVTSAAATLVVIAPPSITSQPASVTANANATASFTVAVQGTAPLSFQWQKNGAPLTDGGNVSGSTAATLNLLNLTSAEAASYQCVVTNSAGNTMSSVATLTIIVPPSVSSQPLSQTANSGALVVFNVSASGSAPLSYSWLKNGVAIANSAKISGATTASLSITNLVATDVGSYAVVVTNAAGSVTSAAATLVVTAPPLITSQPSSVTANANATALFTVAVQGTAPLSFQWQKNGASLTDGGNISGSAAATLNLINLTSADAGSYRCMVTNSAGSATSSVATLAIVVPPSFTSQPLSQTANAGGLAVFNVTATGTAPLSYSWLKNGVPVANSATITGATTTSLTVTNLTATDAGTYSAVITNAAGGVTSAAATLVVIAPPTVTSQPSSVTTNASSSVSFTVVAQGTAPMSFQWQKNGAALAEGGNILGSTSATLNLLNLTSADAGSYRCVVTNAAGTATSSVATLTVIVPPSLTSQPASQTANAGALVMFNVAASGTSPLSYSWLKNGSPIANSSKISGATTASLSITNLNATDAGTYAVVVTNAAGGVTSAAATLVVIAPPAITSQPSSVTTNASSSVSFSVNAQGSGPLNFQWQKNGAALTDGGNILGASSATLNLINATSVDAGSYQCVVTNGAGSTTSAMATLTVIIPPTIAAQPSGQTANAGALAVFNVSATGSAPLSYSWLKNGALLANSAKITGATTASLSITNLAATDAGTYTVVVTNVAGSVTSAAATLVVIAPPSITAQPASVTANTTSTASFTVSAQGSGPLTFQWQKNGAPLTDGGNISGSTSATLNLVNLNSADAGSYRCIVTNTAGSTMSSVATLSIIIPPSVTSQPASQTGNAGSLIVFNVSATGSAPLSYSWLKNGAPVMNGAKIVGATTTSLSITSLVANDAGSYAVAVTNAAGSVTSTAATLVVITPPSISSQPSSLTTNVSSAASFTVAAQGTTPMSFQWVKNGLALVDGGNISGSTSATLNFISVGTGDAGSYQCVATNAAGSVTSSAATLTVIVPPSFTLQPTSQTANAGAMAVFNVSASGTAPLSYSWFKNGTHVVNNTKVTGATTASLSITNLTAADAGSYTAVVTNAAGTVSSSAATLVVIAPPTITSQPSSVTANASGTASFTISAQGAAPMSFQWLKNGSALVDGSDISGASSATLSLINLASGDAGSYQCVVTNAAGSATSSAAMLTVIVPPSLTSQPSSQRANAGALVVFSVSASGTAPLSYSWFKNGTLVVNSAKFTGATTASLSITNLTAADAGSYTAVVTNAAGSATSSGAALVVIAPPSVTSQPSSVTANASATASFTISAQGTAPMSFQWLKNGLALVDGGNISGSTSAMVNLISVGTGDAGSYQCVVTNAAGTATSSAVTLTVIVPPSLTSQPVNQTVNAGALAVFNVSATGTAPLSYTWLKNGTPVVNSAKISGATTASLSVTNLTATDAGAYSVVVTNAGGNVTSSTATLVVIAPPSITAQPSNVTTNASSTASFIVAAQGTAPMSFQWLKNGSALVDGGNISGSTSATLNLINLVSGDAGTYQCVVTNAAGSATSSAATLTVIVPPSLTSQPVNQTANAGALTVFNVSASGTAPLSYSWFKNGALIANSAKITGATTGSLSITNLTATDAGSYTAVVTNAAGNATSSAATLMVITPPSVISQPSSVTANASATASFTVSVQGSAPLSFQWQKNGAPLSDSGNVSGSATATVNLVNLTSADAGSYRCIVTNGAGSTMSSIATLTIIVPPSLTSQPVSQTAAAGSLAVFSVSATGTAPLSYFWLKNGSALVNGGKISGAATTSLTVTNVSSLEAGNYSVIVSNAAGSVSSSAAALTVIAPPAITSQPASATANTGASAVFSVAAQGSAPLSYRWIKNGGAMVDGGSVTGSATAALTLTSVSSSDVGSYQCVITNAAGGVTSSAATLTVTVPPTIVGQPASQTINTGATTVFTVNAAGTSPFTFMWSKNGSPLVNGGKISGATTVSLTVSSAASTDAGTYTAVVTNSAGSATSLGAILEVIVPPSITSQPSNVTTNLGAATMFTVAAQGSAPLRYQWLKSGVAVVDGGTISGSMTSTLTLGSIANSDAGQYQCVVTNAAGTVTSTVATLAVILPPEIATQPGSQTLNSGAIAVLNVSATGTAPFTFTWSKNGNPLVNGANISGATTATLTVNNVAGADAGSYTVMVANSAGSATSSAAILTVLTPPTISAQPASVTANASSQVAFSVNAQGSQSLGFQWCKNGSPMSDGANVSGATSATLTIVSATAADVGSYQCVATNSSGSDTSSLATLTINTPPSITAQPANQTVFYGANAVFNVGVSGTAPFTYVWSKNGARLVDGGNVSGATSAALTVGGVTFANAGTYSCVVSNAAGSATSARATMVVADNSTVLTQPLDQTLKACDTLTLNVTVSGTAPPAYQWMHNGAAVPGQTTATLSVASVSAADAGTYYVQVTAGTVMASSNAVVTVNDPTILTEPADNCVTANSTNVFFVQVCGTPDLAYQWYFVPAGTTNVAELPGATNGSLAIGPTTVQSVGQYFCVVSNAFGSVTSRAASLGVEAAPTITSQPINQTKIVGNPVTFTTAATASAPLTFQWAKDGSIIDGATDSAYTIANAQTTDAGTYSCLVGTTLCQSTASTSSSYGHLTVRRDTSKPTVRFNSPKTVTAQLGTLTSSASDLVLSGSATDNTRVMNVVITRTFPPNALLKIVPRLVGTQTLSYWTNSVALVPGTNIFMAVVTDAAGLAATNFMTLFFRVPSVFHISTNGSGSVTAQAPFTFGTPTNNALLDIGRNYRLFAKPATGMMFSNWVDRLGAEISTATLLEFKMQTNLQIRANFVPNPIALNNAGGTYNGLFYEADELRVKSAGALFNLLVRTDATFSGQLKINGLSYVVSGTFDIHGNATKQVTRAGKTTLSVSLHLDWVTKQLSGTVTSPQPEPWTSSLTGDIAPFSIVNRYPSPSRYTLAIAADEAAPTASPGGFSFGFVTNNSSGIISFIGSLADGTPVSQTVPISQQGYWPLFIPLYGNRGLLSGWLNFSSGAPSGNVSWIRPAGTLTANYTNGFTNVTAAFGSPYTPSTPSFTPADGALDIGPLTWQYAVSNNNAIAVLPGSVTNSLSGSISAPIGSVAVTYRPTGTAVHQTARGAVLQWNNGAYGFVLSNNISVPLHLR